MPTLTKITTNMDNWSGEDITVEADLDALSWEQYGYQFRLESAPWPADIADIFEGENRYRLFCDDQADDTSIIVKNGNAVSDACGISRDAQAGDERVAAITVAVKMICNLY